MRGRSLSPTRILDAPLTPTVFPTLPVIFPRSLSHTTEQGALKLILVSNWLSLGCRSTIAPSVNSCTPCRTLPFLSMRLQKRINQHLHQHQRHTPALAMSTCTQAYAGNVDGRVRRG